MSEMDTNMQGAVEVAEAPAPKERVERPEVIDLREHKATKEEVMAAFRNGGGKAIEEAYHVVRLGVDSHGNLVPDSRGKMYAVESKEADEEVSANDFYHVVSTEGELDAVRSGSNWFRKKYYDIAA